MRSCFWQRDLVPRGHTRRCADTGRLPPGSRTSRFCRIRLLASAAMAPREETPPNQQALGARWAPPEKPAHHGMLLTLFPGSPPHPQDLRHKPQHPPTHTLKRQLSTSDPFASSTGSRSLCTSGNPTLDFCPLQKISPSPALQYLCPHLPYSKVKTVKISDMWFQHPQASFHPISGPLYCCQIHFYNLKDVGILTHPTPAGALPNVREESTFGVFATL